MLDEECDNGVDELLLDAMVEAEDVECDKEYVVRVVVGNEKLVSVVGDGVEVSAKDEEEEKYVGDGVNVVGDAEEKDDVDGKRDAIFEGDAEEEEEEPE